MSKKTYRQEATIRVLYFTTAFLGSCLLAALAGAAAGGIFVSVFPGASSAASSQIFMWVVLAVFSLSCGLSVYKVDKKLSKRFNKNP